VTPPPRSAHLRPTASAPALLPKILALTVLLGLLPLAAAGATESDARIVHALNRLTFGPRPGDVERVRRAGLDAFIEQQLQPERIADERLDAALEALPSLRMSIAELHRQFPRPDERRAPNIASGERTRGEMMEGRPAERRPARILAELQAAKVLRAVVGERQLQEVMADFWFNHFNVFAGKGQLRWYTTPYEREAIRPHALGTFPELVRATARHPAMLFYLDNWLSTRADFVVPFGPNRGAKRGLNENYARELMELHTLGVDGGYSQADVTEVARAFTGWTIDGPNIEGRFLFRPGMHDTSEKIVLGHRLRGGGGGEDGERVIDILVHHPSTARFIATKLVRRFVADDPPPALVERVAVTYRTTGGDVRAMLRTIVAAPEFWASDREGAKIKTPFQYVVSAVRAVGGRVDARGAFEVARASAEIGEVLYGAPPPSGYADRAEQWVNTAALLARMNFALRLVNGGLPGVHTDVPALVAGVDGTRPDVLDRLLDVLVHGRARASTRAVLEQQFRDLGTARRTADDRRPAPADVDALAALVIGSPEFQRR
jgi:uncharacterized protein (DUF1800 family)